MNTVRLLKLADLLEADAANPKGVKFDLDTWASDARMIDLKWDNDLIESLKYDPNTKIIPVSCQTAACAMGLAAISGAFKDEGLSWRINSDGWLVPTFNETESFTAAEEFFDLDGYGEAEYLFSSDRYPHADRKGQQGELAVAKRIREFVANDD